MNDAIFSGNIPNGFPLSRCLRNFNKIDQNDIAPHRSGFELDQISQNGKNKLTIINIIIR